jgi:uncharacterized protein
MVPAAEPESDCLEAPPPRLQVLQVTLSFEGGLAVVALLFAWLSGRDILDGMEWDGRSVAIGFVASVPMFAFLAMTVRSQASPFVRIRGILSEFLLPWMSQCRTIDLMLLSILAGVGEELLFRAFLQSLLGEWLGVAGGLVVASLLFGAAHWITTGYAVLAAVAGFYLGAVWLATEGNTAVVIIAHGVYDFVALVFLMRWHRRGLPSACENSGIS